MLYFTTTYIIINGLKRQPDIEVDSEARRKEYQPLCKAEGQLLSRVTMALMLKVSLSFKHTPQTV